MHIRIVCVGKKHLPGLSTIIDDYQDRIMKLGSKLDWHILSTGLSKKREERKKDESSRILNSLKSDDYVILLDESGAHLNNTKLAKVIGDFGNRGQFNSLVFIIGGAYGVNGLVKERADYIWSLSELVFPHQIVRLLLIEQIYRTKTLLHGHPYHHK